MTPARIMIVEDERITAEDIADILSHLGYTVTAVASAGADAILQAERTAPDLVLMDIRIKGDMDGVETARVLRERFNIPVVYLTAHADRETLGRAKLAEPLGYIVKPFQEAELQASIEIALHKRGVDERHREERESFAAALGVIGEGVISVDGSGLVTMMNAAAEAWTGWGQAEALGKSINQVIQLKGSNPLNGQIASALRSGVLTELDESSVLVDQGGAERPIGGTIAPVRDHTGGVTGAVLVFGDVKQEGAPARPVLAALEPAAFEMVAESGAMKRVVQFARRVAASEASTILLEGESGTGKDVLAKFVHFYSRRQAEPFLAINCAAIPETLLESELFGYEKGAFTDAKAQKKGILELAHGGTVFLDEIGEMPLALQAKMLRVLEDQSFRRLGATKDTQVDLRVITATNRDLREDLQHGRFRLDLYYRLNLIQVTVPALRDRKEDIVPLAYHFIRSYNQRYKRKLQGLSPEAATALVAHDWPGNVRELRNTIERVMILEESEWVQSASLGIPDTGLGGAPVGQGTRRQASLEGLSLEEAERTMLIGALEKSGWNQTRAARLLSISRDALRYKMKKFDLRPSGSETLPKSTGE